jgi:hypothetical protein
MIISEFPCNESFLASFITDFTIIEFNETPEDEISKVPPLGFPVLQFHFGIEGNFYLDHGFRDKAILIGQFTRHVNLRPIEGAKIISANFKPYGLFNLLGLSPETLTDTAVDSSDVFGIEEINAFLKVLKTVSNNKKRLEAIKEFIKTESRKFKQRRNCIYDELVDKIIEKNGLLTVESLIQGKIKLRNLERYFKKHIGIPPKIFMDVLRHKFVLSQMYLKPEFQWSDPSLDGFYYDQSHFNRDFQKFSLEKPLEYNQNPHLFAKILM